MSISQLMEAMAAAGAPMEAIIIAIRAIEAKDAILEAKRAGERDRKRRQRAVTVPGQSQDNGVTVPEQTPSSSPPNEINLTPPTYPPGEIISPAPTRKAPAWPCPDGVNAQHWADLQANRKAKRMPLTPTALDHQLKQIAKFADAEWPPGLIVKHAAANGWAAIHDPRPKYETRNGQRPHHDRPSGWAPRAGASGFEPASLDD